MHKHFESFTCLSQENTVDTYIYNHTLGQDNWASGGRLDNEIYEKAKSLSPDMMVYVGACSGNIPSPGIFAKIRNDVCPTVHFCSDAADEPWWGTLKNYDDAGSFSAQVALDGNKNWPLHEKEITALTPIDPAHYPDPIIPHADRKILFGFAGNPGSVSKLKDGRVVGRRPMVASMMQFGLKIRPRTPGLAKIADAVATYKEAAAYMADTRIMPNFNQTGSFDRQHVKGRVVEAGWAGCLLLEPTGSPAKDWFEPGVDYMEYASMDEARGIHDMYRDKPEETQAFGMRLRKRVENEHGPKQFWNKIFKKVGFDAIP